MNKKPVIEKADKQSELIRKIGGKVSRKINAKRNPAKGVWFGLGMMGLIGWSVVVPTLLGAAFGIWLDNRYPGNYSWTLILLITGLGIGCLNAWFWMQKEEKEMHDKQENNNE